MENLLIMPSRRQLIASSLTGAFVFSLGPALLAQDGGNNIAIMPLADNLYLIQGAGENLLVTESAAGLLLVDGGSAERAEVLLDSLERYFDSRRIHTLINTHWHPQQTGLNQYAGQQGAVVIAHENTRLWLATRTIVRWQGKTYPPAPLEAHPNQTFHDTHSLTFNGETINCGYLLQAHTDGDIYVYFRDKNVIAVGGVMSSNGWPVIDWSTAGWIGGMVQALDHLHDITDEETLIIPATGSPITRMELAAQKVMYRDIMAKLKTMMESGYGVPDVLRENPAAGYKPEWGSPDLFLELAFRSFWGHVRQFDLV
jgi:glyoxylase-like metal-dependent hydrolase (beta-lactamase superfamily II)